MNKSNELIDRIKKENIKSKPKWYFTGKNILIWFMYLAFVLIGAISFSVILFAIQQTDFVLLSHLNHSKLELLLGIIPILWIILLVLFIFGSIYAIYNSKKGFKFTFSKLISFNVGLSILVGTLFFISGGAQWFEKSFSLRAGFYESIQNKKEKIWMNPNEGNIAGKIQSVTGNIIKLEDFDNNTWIITIDSAFIPPAVFLEKDEQVKIVGRKTSGETFIASEILPWGGRDLRKKMKAQNSRKNRRKNNRD